MVTGGPDRRGLFKDPIKRSGLFKIPPNNSPKINPKKSLKNQCFEHLVAVGVVTSGPDRRGLFKDPIKSSGLFRGNY